MMMKHLALEHIEALNGGPLSASLKLRLLLVDVLLDEALSFLRDARKATEANQPFVAEQYREAAQFAVDELRRLADPEVSTTEFLRTRLLRVRARAEEC